MTTTCDNCSKPAITFIRYNGTHLCKDHFIQYFQRRVKKEMRKQGKIGQEGRLGVAISGGKDSIVALYVVHEMFKNRNDVKIFGLTIDEGIKGYRDDSLKIAQFHCKKLGVEHHIVYFKDKIGKNMDEIMNLEKPRLGACSYCGVFRRFCLNTLSKELGINRLITGHNLDDMAQSILMNFINADMEKLARLGPHMKVQPGLIPRMMPLRLIPEKENALYAILNGIEVHDAVCPYSVQAARGKIKDIMYNLEDSNPGTRHSIVKSYDEIKDILRDKYPSASLKECEICHEPTMHKYCKTCLLKDDLK